MKPKPGLIIVKHAGHPQFDLALPNTLNFYGLPVRVCPVRGTQPPGTLGPAKVFFLALVSASAQMI